MSWYRDAPVGYFDQAIEAAQQRGDKAAEGLALLRKSFIALYGWRDPHARLGLTEEAARTTEGISQVLTGLAVLHSAEAHATLGSRRDCEAALDAADPQFGRIRAEDPAIDLSSPTQPGRLAGSCYLFLRDATAAVAILSRRNRGGGGMNVIAGAGRELRRLRSSPEVQDGYDRIMALMAA